MAGVIDKTVIGGLTFELEAKDKVSDQVVVLLSYLQKLQFNFRRIGLSGSDSLKLLEEKLRALAKTGKISIEAFTKLSEILGKNSPLHKALSEITAPGKNNYKFFPAPKEITSVVEAISVAAGAVVSFKALFRPSSEMFAFVNQLSLINDRLYTMSRTSAVAVRDLAGVGSVLRGFGGGAQDYAAMGRSFALAGARLRHGEGIGGNRFIEAQKRVSGFAYNSGDFEATMRSAMRVISDKSRSQEDKLYLKSKLGLSDSMFQAMEKGEEYWNREVAEAKRRSKSSEEAAEKSRAYRIEVAKLQTAWEELKNRALIGLIPLVKGVTEWLVEFNDFIGDTGKNILVWLGGIGLLIGSFRTIFVAVGRLGKALLALKIWMEGLRSVSLATAATSTVAGAGVSTAGAVGKVAGGAVGKVAGGAVGVVANVVGEVAGAVQRQVIIHSLSVMEQVLTRFHDQWYSYTVLSGGQAWDRETINKWEKNGIVSRDLVHAAMMRREYDQDINRFVSQFGKTVSVPEVPKGTNAKDDGENKIVVQRIDITVDGGTNSAPDIAKEVHQRIIQEFVVLAETGAVRA